MPPVTIQDVLSRLHGVGRTGTGFVALCPAHDDQRKSLSIGEGERGVVINCHAGCEPTDVAQKLGIELKDLFYESSSLQAPQVAAEYRYHNEKGELAYVVERRIPKDFRQRRPDPSNPGAWIHNLKGTTALPYRLPELLAASADEPVIIVEGEKDVDALHKRGFCATCNSGGAGKWRPELSRYLGGRRVVIIPDNDEAGRKHARQVEETLVGHASSTTILELEGLPPKGDVSDWFAGGHTTEQLRALLPAAEAESLVDRFIYVHDCDEPPPQEWIWDNLIPKGFITTLYAMGGSSKSFLSQYIGINIALGKPVFDRKVDRGPVLFLDGELDRDSWLRRGYMFARAMELNRLPVGLVYRRVSGSLLEPKGRKDIIDFVRAEEPSLVIIDSFTACLPGADTNSLDDVVARMKAIESFGTVLLIDHARKNSEVGEATPIGSIAKWNFARSAIQLSSSPAGGTIIKHSKSNFGPLCEPIAYTLDISGGQVHIDRIAYTDERLDGVEGALPVSARISQAFTAGDFPNGAKAVEIADHLGLQVKTVRNKLSRLKSKGVLVLDGQIWKLQAGPAWGAA